VKNLSEIAKATQNFTVHNSPTILTAIGVTGVISTAILTGKATYEADKILAHHYDQEKWRLGHDAEIPQLGFKEHVNLVWREYIPAAGMGILTISAIVSANRIGSKRAAAVAAAYSISERAFAEYRDKVVERMGEAKEQRVRDEIAQEHVDRAELNSNTLLISDGGKVLCYDLYSKRPFVSSVEDIKKAQNDTNYQMLRDDSASLSDFYSRIDLEPTSFSDNVGWNTNKQLEVQISTMLSDEQKPVVTIDFLTIPQPYYWKFR
jgi:hypothetical protein